jgi:hypothetical protein
MTTACKTLMLSPSAKCVFRLLKLAPSKVTRSKEVMGTLLTPQTSLHTGGRISWWTETSAFPEIFGSYWVKLCIFYMWKFLTGNESKMAVFWLVAPCSLVVFEPC